MIKSTSSPILCLLSLAYTITLCNSFVPQVPRFSATRKESSEWRHFSSSNENIGDWSGEITSNASKGSIRGCELSRAANSLTTWTVTIDGAEADTGKFGEAIYKKMTRDAKQQQFQGFRAGTIPPHVLPTYKAFTMDEVARETVLEAMEQNNVRPFADARSEMMLEAFCIPPVKKKGKKKKKKGVEGEVVEEGEVWLTFDTMKECISAGWQPGQSFSFVAKNVKGQQIEDGTPIGQGKGIGSGVIDLNGIAAGIASDAAKQ